MGQIEKSIKTQILPLLKIWLVYILLTQLALRYPHWKIDTINIINYDLFFFMFLLSFAVFRKHEYNRYIFLNLAIFSLLYALSFITIFIGNEYAIGDDRILWIVWSYRKIIISIVTSVMIIYIPFDYMFSEKKTGVKYFYTLCCILPLVYIYYYEFISWRATQLDANQYKIYVSSIALNALAIFFIIVYAYLYIKRQRPISGYVNSIVLCSLLFLAVDICDNSYYYLKKDLPVYSQYLLLFNLIIYVGILIRKLIYIDSAFGDFYEDWKFKKRKLDIPVLPKKTIADKLILFLREHLKYVYKRVMLISLIIISTSFFIWLFPIGYIKTNVLVLLVIIIIVMLYLYLFYGKNKK